MRATPLVLLLAVVLAAPAPPAAGQEGPPPTPVPPFGSPSPYPSALETPAPSAGPPELSAEAAALVDLDTGTLLYARRARQRRPVASTTKIMTALVVLEETRPGESVIVSAHAASQRGAALGLRPGERVPVRQLLHALMLQSANDASVALAEHVAGEVGGFVDLMNRRARRMGLFDTEFRSPNGLDDRGYSTARDLALITAEAFEHPFFARVAATRFRRIPDPAGPPRRIQNRNALLWLYPGATGVKTGWTSASGFCLVAAAEREGLRLVGVVLGAPLEAFTDAATLLDHGYAAYARRALVEQGQEVEPLRLDGVEVPVAAGGTLEAVLRHDAQPVLLVRPDLGLSLPLEEGERVGAIEVRAGGRVVGEVPLAVRESVGGEPSPDRPVAPRPWWSLAREWAADVWAGLVALFG